MTIFEKNLIQGELAFNLLPRGIPRTVDLSDLSVDDIRSQDGIYTIYVTNIKFWLKPETRMIDSDLSVRTVSIYNDDNDGVCVISFCGDYGWHTVTSEEVNIILPEWMKREARKHFRSEERERYDNI